MDMAVERALERLGLPKPQRRARALSGNHRVSAGRPQ
jgi:hypothetical protein